MVFLYLVFVTIGAVLVVEGGGFDKALGVVVLAFFGVGGLFSAITTLRRGLAQLTLTPEGIELAAGGTVRWRDVADIGVGTKPTKLVWLRLRGYDRYLASIPGNAPAPDESGRVPRRRGRGRYSASLMRRNRERYGYDMGFTAGWLDRPAPAFVELMEEYRRAAR